MTQPSKLLVDHWLTSTGVRVHFVERRAIPIVDVNIDFEAGSCFDPPGKAGVSEMLASLLLTGQRRWGEIPAMSEELAEHAFDEIGAKVAADAQADRLSIGLRSLSHPVLLERAWHLLIAMLVAPIWHARPFERERERLLAFAQEQRSDPEQLCNLRMTQALYKGHPYGLVADESSIEALSAADVQAFHRRYLVRERAIVTIVGDLSRDAANQLAERLGEALPQSPGTAADLPDAEFLRRLPVQAACLQVEHPASQAHIAIGTLVPGVADDDYFPLMLANRMFSWQLNSVVRDQMGLAYEVSSALFMSRLGEHRIGLKTKGDQRVRALEAVRTTLQRFVEHGVDETEFRRTRAELMRGRALSLDANGKLLRHAADMAFDRLPLDHLATWVERVADVALPHALSVFGRWVDPGRQVAIIVGGGADENDTAQVKR